MHAQHQQPAGARWDVPYLPIDPHDVGRTYEAIIRVNSQSGKGGVAYLLATGTGSTCRAGCRSSFAQKVQAITDAQGGELSAEELHDLFCAAYLDVTRAVRARRRTRTTPTRPATGSRRACATTASTVELAGEGNGPIAALVHALAAADRARRSASSTTTSTR